MSLRIVFMGTPEFAVPTLSAILNAGHDIACVYTQPPRRAGRGMGLRPTPVHAVAAEAGLAVRHPSTLKDPDEQRGFAANKAAVAVVVAYGLILPTPVLAAPVHGCLNLHASLLPRWRGAAPIQRAVMAGDAETGVMVMRMEKGLDTGPVCLTSRVPIGPDDSAGALHDRLAPIGAELMVRALTALEDGALRCDPQPAEGVTYATKIDKAETRIDWRRPAAEVHDHIRGLAPYPAAWFPLGPNGSGDRVRALQAVRAEGEGPPGTVLDAALTVACGEGAVRLLHLQRAGKAPMAAADFLRGHAIAPGTVLG